MQGLGFKPPANPNNLTTSISSFIQAKSKEGLTETNLSDLLGYLGATVPPEYRYACGIKVGRVKQELKSLEI